MNTTPVSLLQRLRQPACQDAWARFVKLYTPLLYYWVYRTNLPKEEADDLVQEVFAVLVQKLPQFQYDEHKTFRGWLRTVALNKLRERQRRRGVVLQPLDGVNPIDANGSDPAAKFWDAELHQHLYRRALELMQRDFPEKTWQACWQVVVEGKTAAEVAAAQGTTVGAVHAAKFRVLTRLRQELAGMMD
jgi:RNA polymerase sigma-70 factor (ECF subfamily)